MALGDFCWYELMTRDAGAANKFYEAVVGWSGADSGMAGEIYLVMSASTGMVAGIYQRGDDCPPDAPSEWLGYIAVEDVDAMTERVRETGGRVHKEPADIPNVGRFSIVVDPEGAVFMLFKAGGTPPPEAAPDTPGLVGWQELHTADLDRAWEWYAGHFGWRKSQSFDMGPHGVYQTFTTNDAPMTGGMMGGSKKARWKFYINVPEINQAVAIAREQGGKIEREPMQVPGGSWVVEGVDPTGAIFNLISRVSS